MGDRRIVQCFGVKRKPHKKDEVCGRQFLWTARGAASGHFGGNGTQACPNCGTLPDFSHPFNIYLDGTITYEKAEEMMPAYREKLGLPTI